MVIVRCKVGQIFYHQNLSRGVLPENLRRGRTLLSTSDARIQLWTLNSMKFGVYQKVAQYIKYLVPCTFEMKLWVFQKVAQYIKNLVPSIYVVMLYEKVYQSRELSPRTMKGIILLDFSYLVDQSKVVRD